MDNYLFQAAPKPVQTRTKKHTLYREPEESKEVPRNLMYDRRVARGSTYAPSKRTQPLPNATFRPVQQQQQNGYNQIRTPAPPSAAQQHPLPPSSSAGGRPEDAGAVDFIRIATPEPVAGRSHCSLQTDTYLEDLRYARGAKGVAQDFATQTDAENDRPTPALFVPRSSGDDVATEIDLEGGDLFDFDMEVQAVVGTLVEKALEQALMSVCEEEELAQLEAHQAAHQQRKNNELAAVQQLVQRDERRQAERDRRAKQEADRLEAERRKAAAHQAALLSKRMVERLQEDTLKRLVDEGAFFDPVRREVDTQFMPRLLEQTFAQLQAHQRACDALDGIVQSGLSGLHESAAQQATNDDEQFVQQLVAHLLEPEKHPRPQRGIRALANKLGQEEEDAARRALQLSAEEARALAAEAAALSRKGAAAAAAASANAASPEARAAAIVANILAERQEKEERAAKEAADIVRIQALHRGNRDRARVHKLAEKRRMEAERAAMSPAELLVSLANNIGFTVSLLPASASAAGASASAAAAAAAPSSDAVWVVSSIEAAGPASQAGLALGDQVEAFGADALDLTPLDSADAAELLQSPTGLKADPYALNPGSTLLLQVVRRSTDGRRELVSLEIGCGEDGEYKEQHERVRDLRADAELPISAQPWYDSEQALDLLHKLPGKLGATVSDSSKGGARLVKVTPGVLESAAARAGLTEGDVLVSLDGAPLPDGKALTSALKERMAGDVLTLELLTAEGKAKLKEAPGGEMTARSVRKLPTQKKIVELGGGGKKLSLEQVRGLRRIAGLPVFGEP